jgi:hypothetical protein
MTTAIHHRIGRRVPGVEESPGWDMGGMAEIGGGQSEMARRAWSA